MKRILIFALFFFSLNVTAAQEPGVLLRQAADTMIVLLEENKEKIAQDEKIAHQIVRENLLPLIDTDGLGKRLLKRKVWQNLTPVQQNRFTEAFINHLIKTYAKGLANYDGHKFQFNKTDFSTSGQTAWVYSEILSKTNESFGIIYTLKKFSENDSWKVIDISVEGIKILQNYREQLKSVEVTDGFDALLAKLESTDTSQ